MLCLLLTASVAFYAYSILVLCHTQKNVTASPRCLSSTSQDPLVTSHYHPHTARLSSAKPESMCARKSSSQQKTRQAMDYVSDEAEAGYSSRVCESFSESQIHSNANGWSLDETNWLRNRIDTLQTPVGRLIALSALEALRRRVIVRADTIRRSSV